MMAKGVDGAIVSRRTIVIFSATPWQGLVGRPHHLARHFASRGERVLFVEPAITWLSPLKKLKLLLKFHFGRLLPLEENLAVLTPPPIMPAGYRFRAVNKLNQTLLERSIMTALRRLDWPAGLVITHLPGTADFPGTMPLLYECVDDHAAFSQYSSLWQKEVVQELEYDLLRRARGVVATAQVLFARCQKYHPKALLIGNGAAVEHFSDAAGGKSGATGLSGLVAGFYGGIGAWVDLELIARAAELAPHWSFYLAGPREGSVELPRFPGNVFLPGFIPFAELPPILADFDVALLPFKTNELTISVNPIKLYEYFAAGKPVLVADIPELTRWGELVYPVTSASDLVAALETACHESAELKAKRQQVAMDNSWAAKVDLLLDYMKGLGL